MAIEGPLWWAFASTPTFLGFCLVQGLCVISFLGWQRLIVLALSSSSQGTGFILLASGLYLFLTFLPTPGGDRQLEFLLLSGGLVPTIHYKSGNYVGFLLVPG